MSDKKTNTWKFWTSEFWSKENLLNMEAYEKMKPELKEDLKAIKEDFKKCASGDFCKACNRQVKAVKSKFSFGWFIIWCLTIFGGILYILYHFLLKFRNKCPMCGLNTQ